MDIFNRIRWQIPFNKLNHIIYIDSEGNEWPLNDPMVHTILSYPLYIGSFILYFPNPLTGKNDKFVFNENLSTLDILAIINDYYNRELTPEERKLAIETGYKELIPDITNSLVIIRFSDLLGSNDLFEGFSRYEDGWRIRFGY